MPGVDDRRLESLRQQLSGTVDEETIFRINTLLALDALDSAVTGIQAELRSVSDLLVGRGAVLDEFQRWRPGVDRRLSDASAAIAGLQESYEGLESARRKKLAAGAPLMNADNMSLALKLGLAVALIGLVLVGGESILHRFIGGHVG